MDNKLWYSTENISFLFKYNDNMAEFGGFTLVSRWQTFVVCFY
jgi:hypothetical protein